jgi:hypothetical protein
MITFFTEVSLFDQSLKDLRTRFRFDQALQKMKHGVAFETARLLMSRPPFTPKVRWLILEVKASVYGQLIYRIFTLIHSR